MTTPHRLQGAPEPLPAPRVGLILLALALAFGASGPFGTALAMSPGMRVGYWLATVLLLGGGNWAACRLVAAAFFGGRLPWWAMAAIGAGLAVPGTLVVRSCIAVAAPGLDGHLTDGDIFLRVLGMNLVLAPLCRLLALGIAAARGPAVPAVAPAPPAAAPIPKPAPLAVLPAANPLADLLPPGLARSPLLALSAEDHYLRVHTEAGNGLVLMALSAAAERLADADGLRVHRSHWVSRAALRGTERRRGQVYLRLSGGLTVPVSRSRLDALRAAGWLDA